MTWNPSYWPGLNYLQIEQKDFPLVREILVRGLNCYPKQNEPEAQLIRNLIQAMQDPPRIPDKVEAMKDE
jgi:hypothetical protein